jgi:hypothetical protein
MEWLRLNLVFAFTPSGEEMLYLPASIVPAGPMPSLLRPVSPASLSGQPPRQWAMDR